MSIKLAPYKVSPDGSNFIVEFPGEGGFFEMSPSAVDALHALAEGMEPKRAERMLKLRYPDEAIDIREFVGLLEKHGLLRLEDEDAGRARHGSEAEPAARSPLLGRMLFHPGALWAYGLCFAGNLGIFIIHPELFPHYSDLLPFPSMAANALVAMALSLMLVLVHESGHVLAIRAFGQPARLRLGHRLFFVVLETEMNAVWRLPRKQRNVPYLAGLCFDHTLLFASLVLLLFARLPEFIVALLEMSVFCWVMNTFFQCMFFMKTDLYYVFENMTGCYNLMENAFARLKRKIPFAPPGREPELFAGEERIVRMYAVFLLAGTAGCLAVFFGYALPQIRYVLGVSVARLLHPSDPGYKLDAVVILFQFALALVLLLVSLKKKAAASRK